MTFFDKIILNNSQILERQLDNFEIFKQKAIYRCSKKLGVHKKRHKDPEISAVSKNKNFIAYEEREIKLK